MAWKKIEYMNLAIVAHYSNLNRIFTSDFEVRLYTAFPHFCEIAETESRTTKIVRVMETSIN
jgi:hypothetical protein